MTMNEEVLANPGRKSRCEVLAIALSKMSIIAGAGSNNPVEAIEYTKVAEKAGADATLHVAGYYNRPNQDGLYAHFKTLHDATNIPIILYNIPGRAVVNILPETVAKLAELPRIAGIKDATGDLARPWVERQLIKRNDFVWLSGEDATAVSYNVAGGTGVISVTANVAPKLVAEVQALTLAGKYIEAREKQDRLMRLHKLMFKEPSPAGAKYACSLLGLCTEECRLPVMNEISYIELDCLIKKVVHETTFFISVFVHYPEVLLLSTAVLRYRRGGEVMEPDIVY